MQFMPFKPKVRAEAEKAINSIGDLVYPVMTAMSLPIFMYNIVLEKENKLIQNMKINGMKMSNYWLVTGIFNFGIYTVLISSYYGFGRYISGLSFFTESNPTIMIVTYIGWGLNQVALSFLFSCFLSDSQSAQMVGYAVSIMACITASTLMLTGGIYNWADDLSYMYM
jgi:hypothetical protein